MLLRSSGSLWKIVRNTSRSFCSSQPQKIFDRELKWTQLDTLAQIENIDEYHYLRDEVGRRLLDRLYDVKNPNFDKIVDISSNFKPEHLKTLQKFTKKKILQLSPSIENLKKSRMETNDTTQLVVADEEYIPLKNNSVNLITSNLAFHWINDLPGTFIQARQALKPDGMLMVSMFGGNTLKELRESFIIAEQERESGIGVHVSPFARVVDLGNLLTKAGFNLPTIDNERIVIRYPSAWVLMQELGMMGESNVVFNRRENTPLDTILAAAAIYQENYQFEDGTIPATFEVLYGIGWVPHESQQKALPRGSAEFSLKQLEYDTEDTETEDEIPEIEESKVKEVENKEEK